MTALYDPFLAERNHRLKQVRLLALDFDGVLTDNHVYTFADGSEVVRSWRGDGMGLERLRSLGIHLVVISGENNQVVWGRCQKLLIDCVWLGIVNKRERLEFESSTHSIMLSEMAYVGNDVNDLDCLMAVGLPFIVADAHPSLLGKGFYLTEARGGEGAVREVCDLITSVHEALIRV